MSAAKSTSTVAVAATAASTMSVALCQATCSWKLGWMRPLGVLAATRPRIAFPLLVAGKTQAQRTMPFRKLRPVKRTGRPPTAAEQATVADTTGLPPCVTARVAVKWSWSA